jgi:hypothetical protein
VPRRGESRQRVTVALDDLRKCAASALEIAVFRV